MKTTIFWSFSSKDMVWRERLQDVLVPLVSEEFSLWDYREIRPGELWQEEIFKAIRKAQIAVCLVSADFYASEFITDHELPRLVSAARRKSIRLIPVAIGHAFDGLNEFEFANNPARPLNSLSRPRRELELLEIAKKICSVAYAI